MASAAPPKRVVSSFFITLASPHRASVTQQQQQQPALQTHSAAGRDKQHTAVRVSPSGNIPSIRHKKEDHSHVAESYGGLDGKGRTREGASNQGPDHQSPKSATSVPSRGKQEDDQSPAALGERKPPPRPNNHPDHHQNVIYMLGSIFDEAFTQIHPNPNLSHDLLGGELLPPPPAAALTSSLRTSFSEESASLKTPFSEESELPPPPPVQPPHSHPLTPGQQPGYNSEVETRTPSSGLKQDQSSEIHKNDQDMSRESKDVCGFCRKPVALSQPAIEALNRIYHDSCFQCRFCHVPLAGKHYYNKAGIPLCADCYQASLELCWACGEAITDQVIRALERAYHLSCFTCETCKQQIGEQSFAQGEVGEVYCLQDYYRKYAPKCRACSQLIIPKEDGTDSYNVECLGHSYHENCYRCEDCLIQLSPEPNEKGCYPLDGKMLCRSCHLSLVSGHHH